VASGDLLAIDAAWLLVLAFGYLAISRELALVDHRTRLYGSSVPDGLDVGAPAPIVARITPADLFIFLFGDCGGCHELLAHLSDVKDRTGLAVVVRDETNPKLVETMARRVPSDIITYTGELAQRLVDAFNVHSAPIAIGVNHGVVVAKGYLRNADDIERMMIGKATRSQRST
jgi:hypothetical protein